LQSNARSGWSLAAVRATGFREDFARQHKIPQTGYSIEYGDLVNFVDFEYPTGVTRARQSTRCSTGTQFLLIGNVQFRRT
jgi:hypothetical protein